MLGLQKEQKPHLTFMVKMEFKAVTTSFQNRESLENKLMDTTGGMGGWGEFGR